MVNAMADANVMIQIGADVAAAETGIRTISRTLEDLSRRAESATNSCDLLKKALYAVTGIGIGQAVLQGLTAIKNAFIEVSKIALDYNKTLENSRLGIGAIVYSMAQITDASGKALEGQEKFNAAMQVAVKVQRDLEVIAMSTAATYQELVTVYQAILAPAMAAKLTIGETTTLTGLLANSVKAIGLPMNQIVQESRDLLTGNIDNNSTLAKSLGITREMVKEWTAKKTLFDEITKKLEGFTYASKEFENTWDGAVSNLKDAFQKVLGTGLSPLMQPMIDGVKAIASSFLDIERNADGTVKTIKAKQTLLEGMHTFIANPLYKAWLSIKGIAESIYSLFNLQDGALKVITQGVVILGKDLALIVDAWGWIAAVALPAAAKGVGQIGELLAGLGTMAYQFGEIMVSAMLAVGDSLGKVAKAAWQAITGDFAGAGATLGEMFKGTATTNMKLWSAELGKTATGFKGTVAGMGKTWDDFLDKTVDWDKGLNNNPLKKLGTFGVEGNEKPEKVDPKIAKQAEKELTAYEAYVAAYLATQQKYGDLRVHQEKIYTDEMLGEIARQVSAGLLTEKQGLEESYSFQKSAGEKALAEAVAQAKRMAEAANKATLTALVTPGVTFADNGSITEVAGEAASKAAMEREKALGKEAEATIKQADAIRVLVDLKNKFDRAGSKQTEEDRLKILRDTNKEYERQQKIIQEISAAKAANDANEAGMTGMSASGGFDSIADQTANATAIQAAAHKAQLDMIEEKRTANEKAAFDNLRTMEQYTAREIELDREKALALKKNTLATGSIAEKSYKSQLSMAGQYTGMAGQLFSALASTQDQSSRSGFESAKAFNIAAAIMSTAQAIISSLAAPGGAANPMNIAAMALAATTGAIQIANIAATSFGGGASAPTAPSGSGAAGGANGTTSAASLGSSVASPTTSIADQQTGKQLDDIAAKMGNAALAMGRSADSPYIIAGRFSGEGAASNLSAMAPGRFKSVKEATNGVNYSKEMFGNVLQAVTGTGLLVALGKSAFGRGPWTQTAAGFNMNMKDGELTSQDYTTSKSKGGWFRKDRSRTDYSDSGAQFVEAINAELDKMQGGLRRSAVALGMGGTAMDKAINNAALNLGNIATAGRSMEDIGKDLEAAFNKMSNSVITEAMPDILNYAVNSAEDATAVWNRLSTAMQDVNYQVALVGGKISTGNAPDAAYNLEQQFGGKEAMATAYDAYRQGMYTEAERTAQDTIAATRTVTEKFIEINNTRVTKGLSDIPIPKTIAEFNALRNSIDPLNAETQDLSVALTMLGTEAFPQMLAAVDEAIANNKDLMLGLLNSYGDSAEAVALRRSFELAKITDESTKSIQQYVWAQEDLIKANEKAVAVAKTAVLEAISLTQSILNTKKTLLSGAAANLSPEVAYQQAKSTLAGSDAKTVAANATAFIAASKAYNASGTAYQSDFAQAINKLDSFAGVVGDLSDTEKQLALLDKIAKAVGDGDGVLVNVLSKAWEAATLGTGDTASTLAQAVATLNDVLNTSVSPGTTAGLMTTEIANITSVIATTIEPGTAQSRLLAEIAAVQESVDTSVTTGTTSPLLAAQIRALQNTVDTTVTDGTAHGLLTHYIDSLTGTLNTNVTLTPLTNADARLTQHIASLTGVLNTNVTLNNNDARAMLLEEITQLTGVLNTDPLFTSDSGAKQKLVGEIALLKGVLDSEVVLTGDTAKSTLHTLINGPDGLKTFLGTGFTLGSINATASAISAVGALKDALDGKVNSVTVLPALGTDTLAYQSITGAIGALGGAVNGTISFDAAHNLVTDLRDSVGLLLLNTVIPLPAVNGISTFMGLVGDEGEKTITADYTAGGGIAQFYTTLANGAKEVLTADYSTGGGIAHFHKSVVGEAEKVIDTTIAIANIKGTSSSGFGAITTALNTGLNDPTTGISSLTTTFSDALAESARTTSAGLTNFVNALAIVSNYTRQRADVDAALPALNAQYKSGTITAKQYTDQANTLTTPLKNTVSAGHEIGISALSAPISGTDYIMQQKALTIHDYVGKSSVGLASYPYVADYDLGPLKDYKINPGGALDIDDLVVWMGIMEGSLLWSDLKKQDGSPLPAFATGTNYLPSDMVAQIHEGERIIPKADNAELMRRLSRPNSTADNSETVAELKEQNRLLRELIANQKAGHLAIATSTGESNRTLKRWEGGGMPEVRVAA